MLLRERLRSKDGMWYGKVKGLLLGGRLGSKDRLALEICNDVGSKLSSRDGRALGVRLPDAVRMEAWDGELVGLLLGERLRLRGVLPLGNTDDVGPTPP